MRSMLPYLATLLIMGLALYAHTLRFPFVYDDQSFIVDNESIRSLKNWVSFFKEPSTLAANQELAHDNYRPLVTISYALNYAAGELAPLGYRLVNLGLHLVNTFLVFFLTAELFNKFSIRRKQEGFWPEFVSAAIFLIHPVQVETVVFVSQRSGLLCLAFGLTAFLLHVRKGGWSVTSTALFAASLLCKEMTIILPFLILTLEFLIRQRGALVPGSKSKLAFSALNRSWPYFAVSAGFFALRSFMLGRVGQSAYWAGSLFPTLLTMSKGIAYYLKLLFLPYPMSLEYLFPVSRSLTEPLVILSILLISSCFALAYWARERRPLLAYGVVFFFIGLLPVSNLVPIKAVIQERFLYLSMVGFSLVVADVALRIPTKRLLPAVLIALGFLSLVRTSDWHTPRDLIFATLRTCPESSRMHYALGLQYFHDNQFDEAIKEFSFALAIDPASADFDLSPVLALEGAPPADTLEQYRRTLQVRLNYRETLFNLGTAYLKKGSYEPAIKALELASTVPVRSESDTSDVMILSNLAAAYGYSGKLDKAINLCVDILTAHPELTKTHYNLALYYRAIGLPEPAEKQLRIALEQKPDFTAARTELDSLKNGVKPQ
jgi:tetratricopeptide (TPR) repeat protein